MTVSLYKWTIEEWHTLVESGVLADKKVELLAGDIVYMSPEGVPHRNTNHEVAKYLRKILGEMAEVYEAHPVTLSNSEPEPDIAVVKAPSNRYRNHHPVAEDIYWLIEVSKHTLAKDLGDKARIYARNNIAEYWVIDLQNKKVIVHTQPSLGKYQEIKELRLGALSPLAFPEIEVRLDKILLY